MNAYTLICLERFQTGSHTQTIPKLLHVTAETSHEAIEKAEYEVVFIFHGHLQSI